MPLHLAAEEGGITLQQINGALHQDEAIPIHLDDMKVAFKPDRNQSDVYFNGERQYRITGVTYVDDQLDSEERALLIITAQDWHITKCCELMTIED